MNLDDHTSALRAAGESDGDDAARASATRLRVRESLEAAGRTRARVLGVSAGLGVLLVATASWALATGRLQELWRGRTPDATSAHDHAPTMQPAPDKPDTPDTHAQRLPDTPVVTSEPTPAPAPVQEPAIAQVMPTPVPPGPAHRAPAAIAPAPAPIATSAPSPAPIAAPPPATDDAPPADPAPVEALYQRAHDLHFHGTDYAAALAAWDAYLAAEPHGPFAIEARYNRALCLVRVGKLADARTALEPFAHGDVQPRGYRQAEAAALVARITKRLGR